MRILVAVMLSLLLAACGGDGGGDDEVEMPDDQDMPEVMLLAADPRVSQLRGIVERTDVLLVPGIHANYSFTPADPTTWTSVFEGISCTGPACTAFGEAFDLADSITAELIDPSSDTPVSEVEFGTRGDGFDTASITGSLDPSLIGQLVPDVTITEIPEVLAYGFWDRHGMAGLSLADGSFSGQTTNDVPVSGDIQIAVPFAFGDTTGTNPVGFGEGSWTGIAELVALRTFRRQEGTVTLTIPDLSAATATVSVNLRDDAGNPIGEPGWTDLPLSNGHFMVGAAGNDYLEGNFHGENHGEAYGVFDMTNYTGAFGAKRETPGQ